MCLAFLAVHGVKIYSKRVVGNRSKSEVLKNSIQIGQETTQDLGGVRLTVFRNKNAWSDDSKRSVWRF